MARDPATHVSLGHIPPIFKELSSQSLGLGSAAIPALTAGVDLHLLGNIPPVGWRGLFQAFVLEECVLKLFSKRSNIILTFPGGRTWHQRDSSSDSTLNTDISVFSPPGKSYSW